MKTWMIQPLHTSIVELLEEKDSLSDTELFQTLKTYYENVGFDVFNVTLMKMEVTGLISVSSLSKGKRLVQLNKLKAK